MLLLYLDKELNWEDHAKVIYGIISDHYYTANKREFLSFSLNEKMSALLFYTLFYLLMSGCIIYPPTEFVSAGLTVKDVFANWLGSENEFFIQYHIRRSVATLLLHSTLPLGKRHIFF